MREFFCNSAFAESVGSTREAVVVIPGKHRSVFSSFPFVYSNTASTVKIYIFLYIYIYINRCKTLSTILSRFARQVVGIPRTSPRVKRVEIWLVAQPSRSFGTRAAHIHTHTHTHIHTRWSGTEH